MVAGIEKSGQGPQAMRPEKKGKGLHHAGPYGLLARASCPDVLSKMGAIIAFE